MAEPSFDVLNGHWDADECGTQINRCSGAATANGLSPQRGQAPLRGAGDEQLRKLPTLSCWNHQRNSNLSIT